MSIARIPPQTWARIENGFVVEIRTVEAGKPAPWDNARAIRVTGVPCEIGFAADRHGNVAPRAGRYPLREGEAAYCAPCGVPAEPSGSVAIALAAANVHPEEDAEKLAAEHDQEDASDG
ncbi:hypothetical protein [Acetobacter sp. P5B1]|uniref:hypothetical protein n=1 Tax=Acetobacter sp. P5B1 TaxID=2762620 RepID=UPI001C03E245|nr:hypothetical protein [Acetobacter sp. P5B1]